LTDAEQSGVRIELLAAPVVGPVRGEVVVRRAPTAYMVGVHGGEDAITKRMQSVSTKLGAMRGEASDLLAALSARKEMVHKGVAGGPGKAAGEPAGGPKEGEGVTGGPGKAAGEPDTGPKEGEGGAGGPEKAAGEPGDGPKKDEGGAGGPVKAAGGPTQPSGGDQRGPSGAESTAGGPQTGSSAELAADATTEGSGGGRGNKGAGKGAESEVPEERAIVELNEKGEVKRNPKFWGPPLQLPDQGKVYGELAVIGSIPLQPVPPVPKETLLERLPAALEAQQAAGGGDQEEERGSEGEPTEEHAERGASRKGKRPIEPMPPAEEVAKEAAKRSKRAKKGEKAAIGVEESAGMECPPGEEMAAGSESAASKQVAPVLGAGEGEKAATNVEESAGMEWPPRGGRGPRPAKQRRSGDRPRPKGASAAADRCRGAANGTVANGGEAPGGSGWRSARSARRGRSRVCLGAHAAECSGPRS
jgi:hypothetical protein